MDKILTNLKHHNHEYKSSTPIGLSDHHTVLWQPLQSAKKRHVLRTRIVRPIADSDQRAFGQWITNDKWSEVEVAKTAPRKKTSILYEVLHKAIDKNFFSN